MPIAGLLLTRCAIALYAFCSRSRFQQVHAYAPTAHEPSTEHKYNKLPTKLHSRRHLEVGGGLLQVALRGLDLAPLPLDPGVLRIRHVQPVHDQHMPVAGVGWGDLRPRLLPLLGRQDLVPHCSTGGSCGCKAAARRYTKLHTKPHMQHTCQQCCPPFVTGLMFGSAV